MIEKDLISALIECPERLDDVLEHISAEDFSDNTCKAVFTEMVVQGKFDIHTLTNKFRSNKDNVSVKLLVDVAGTGFGSSAVEYAKVIKEESKKRKALAMAQQLITETGSEMSAQEVIERMGERLLTLYDTTDKTFRSAKDMIVSYLERLVMLSEKGSDISGLSTGWRCVDLATDGLKPGELIIVGGRPSQGKSSVMTQIAYHIAVVLKLPVAVFSIESPESTIMDKIISQKTGIETRVLRTGKLTKEQNDTMMFYMNELSVAPLYLNDVSSININKIKYQIKRLINSGVRPACVMLDYIQIVETDKGGDTRAAKVGRIGQELKNIAKELNAPVVALAQLNRSVEDTSPSLYSLKESGDLEQIADQVWLLHREEFYRKDKCSEEKKGKIDLDIAKNRDGQTLALSLNWVGSCTRVDE